MSSPSRPATSQSDRLYMLSTQGEYGEIIKYIRNHEQEGVRYGAAGVLSESLDSFTRQKTPELQNELIKVVLTDPSDQVRGKVMEILLGIDESIANTVITRLAANPNAVQSHDPYPLILTRWNSSSHPSLRYLAVAGLGRINNSTAVTKLRTKIKQEDNIRVLCRSIKEAGRIGDESFVTPIQEHLRADDYNYYTDIDDNTYSVTQVKHQAIESLVEIGTDAAYEALVTSTRSSDEELKQHAIKEIGRLGAQDTVDVIVKELDTDEGDNIREDAAEGIITAFKESEFERGDEIRQSALQLIADDVSTDVSREFAAIITEENTTPEKRNAAWLLGELDETSNPAVESLFKCIRADDTYLQRIAAASLSKLDGIDEVSIEDKVSECKTSIAEDSEHAHKLCEYLENSLTNSAQEAKKNAIEYTYVTSPEDYQPPDTNP